MIVKIEHKKRGECDSGDTKLTPKQAEEPGFLITYKDGHTQWIAEVAVFFAVERFLNKTEKQTLEKKGGDTAERV